ncbi:MAG: serine/threonine-protein kinase [Acidobacteriota bacterium]
MEDKPIRGEWEDESAATRLPETADHPVASPQADIGIALPGVEVLPAGARIGRFEIVDLVGRGGMAVVYKARDPDLDRIVALKLLRAEDPQMAVRLMNEARAQARIEHECICKVHEVGEADGRRYIAMQYIAGDTLGVAASRMGLAEKVLAVKRAAEAVHAAHRLGLIHRDIKPGNIMVERLEDGSWKPYVLDFGLVRDMEAPGLTSTRVLMGTPEYMSPEQASGRIGDVDVRTDVYSLGATLYEVLSGKLVFEGTPFEVISALLGKEPRSLRSIDTRIPLDLDTIAMKCIEKDPEKRYASAKSLAEDLGRFLSGEPILARRAERTGCMRQVNHVESGKRGPVHHEIGNTVAMGATSR